MPTRSTPDAVDGACIDRRSLLVAAGGALAAGLAGCSEVTDQSFEAAPVVLPGGDREELVLAETARDSETTTAILPRSRGPVRSGRPF